MLFKAESKQKCLFTAEAKFLQLLDLSIYWKLRKSVNWNLSLCHVSQAEHLNFTSLYPPPPSLPRTIKPSRKGAQEDTSAPWTAQLTRDALELQCSAALPCKSHFCPHLSQPAQGAAGPAPLAPCRSHPGVEGGGSVIYLCRALPVPCSCILPGLRWSRTASELFPCPSWYQKHEAFFQAISVFSFFPRTPERSVSALSLLESRMWIHQ